MRSKERLDVIGAKAAHGDITGGQPIAKVEDNGGILAPARGLIIMALTMVLDHPGERRQNVSGVFGSKTEV